MERIDKTAKSEPQRKIEDFRLHELERISRLRLNVHANDFEPGAVITLSRAAGTTKQVEQTRPSFG